MPKIKSLAELRSELKAKQKELAKLKHQRDALSKKLAAVDRQIVAISGEKVAGGKASAVSGKRPKNTKPLVEYLVAALKGAKDGRKAKELAAAVKKAGYATNSANFLQTVARTLATDKRFKRLGHGVYALSGK